MTRPCSRFRRSTREAKLIEAPFLDARGEERGGNVRKEEGKFQISFSLFPFPVLSASLRWRPRAVFHFLLSGFALRSYRLSGQARQCVGLNIRRTIDLSHLNSLQMTRKLVSCTAFCTAQSALDAC